MASVDAALDGADLVLHLTDWPEFGEVDPQRAGQLVRNRQIIDGRNSLDDTRWRMAGWSFHGLGRGGRNPMVDSDPEITAERPAVEQRHGVLEGIR